jgi:hypothetical protein
VTQNFGRVNAHREPSQQEIYPQQLFGVWMSKYARLPSSSGIIWG